MSPDKKTRTVTSPIDLMSKLTNGLDRRLSKRRGTAHRESSQSYNYELREKYAEEETLNLIGEEPEERLDINSIEGRGFYSDSGPLAKIIIARGKGKTVISTIDTSVHVYDGPGADTLARKFEKRLKLVDESENKKRKGR